MKFTAAAITLLGLTTFYSNIADSLLVLFGWIFFLESSSRKFSCRRHYNNDVVTVFGRMVYESNPEAHWSDPALSSYIEGTGIHKRS